MDEKLVEYINGIVDRMEYARQHRMRNMVCIKYYNSFEMDEDKLYAILSSRIDNLYNKFHCFRLNYIYDAYEPFLPWIRDIYNDFYKDVGVDTFVEKCDIYPLHRQMICNYIREGICVREEQVVVSEVEYDRKMFMKSIVNILDYVSRDRNIVLVLSKLHLAPESICQLLTEMIESGKCRRLVVVAGYNELYSVPLYMQDSWSKFVKQTNKHNLQIEWDLNPALEMTEAERESFIPDMSSATEYCRKMYNMMNTLALGQGEYYAEIIRYFQDADNNYIDEKTRINLLIVDSYISIYAGNYKNSFQLCEKLRKFDGYAKNLLIQYEYNKLLILTKVYGGQKESAFKNVVRCNELANKIGDDAKIFESHVLRCITDLDGWKDVILYEKDVVLPDDFEENAVKYHWMNHLSYIYFFGFADNRRKLEESYVDGECVGCENSPYFRKGMEIAQQLRNEEAILSAWKKNIIIYSTTNRFEATKFYYEKCLAILRDNNREEDEAQLYNGAGYYSIIREEFQNANDLFKKALDIFIRVDQPYLACESVYNMAVNSMAAGDYAEAEKCIRTCIETIRLMHKQRIRVANLSKLYGILTISYIMQGKEYNARLYRDKMKNVLRHLLDTDTPNYSMWEDDIFLYYLSCGILAERDGNDNEAEELYKIAEKMWKLQPVNQFYVFDIFVCEACKVYKKIGKEEESERILNIGIKYYEELGQSKKVEKMKMVLSGAEMTNEQLGFTVSREKYGRLIDMVEKFSLNMEIAEKTKHMDFLENWVELLNNDNGSVDAMIERAMSNLENTYNIDKLIYLELESGRPVLKYCDRNFPVSGSQIKGIVNYFSKNRKSIVVNRFENDYDKYRELTDIFGRNNIFSMIGVTVETNNELTRILIAIRAIHENFTQGTDVFSYDEMNVFKTAFRQLLDTVARKIIKIQLEKSSVTDLLTGLHNRQGLKKELESLFVGNGRVITILYLDLDNFKYCNDHFGHEAGDAVLIAFSRMLQYVVGFDSIITRYGGDEFVVVLPDKDITDGINIAEGIFKEISNNCGFIQNISEVCGRTVEIAEKDRVSCSIGIASDLCINYDETNGVMVKADEALYKVKKTTKNNYEVWQ